MTENATTNETVTKTTKKKAPKKITAKNAKSSKAAKSKVDKPPRESREGWGTFALKLPVAEREAFHNATGAAGASRFARTILGAFANEDETAFRNAITEARKLRTA